MILDQLSHADRYRSLGQGIADGIDYLQQFDPATTAAGKHILDDDRLYSVVLEEPAPEERVATLRTWWAWVVSGLAAAAWLLLALGGPLPRHEAAASALAVVAAAGWLPLSAMGRVAPLLDPATFGLSGPLSLSLARLAAVTVAMFDHPTNPRSPAGMFTMLKPFAYISATPNVWKEPLVIKAGQTVTLRYGVALWDGRIDKPTIERTYQQWLKLSD